MCRSDSGSHHSAGDASWGADGLRVVEADALIKMRGLKAEKHHLFWSSRRIRRPHNRKRLYDYQMSFSDLAIWKPAKPTTSRPRP
jgi:hypothetical protein